MMVFRAKGSRFYTAKVPTRSGTWVNRAAGTMDPVVSRAIDRMLEQLGPDAKQAWDVLDRLTSSPPTLTIARLYQLWKEAPVTRHNPKTGAAIEPSPDDRLEYVRATLQSVDVEPLVEEFRSALVGPSIAVRPDTAAHYVSAVRILVPEGKPFGRELLTEQRIREWLEEMDDVRSATARKRAIGLHQFITWLKRRGVLSHDPMRDIDLPPAGAALCHYLDVDEVIALADHQAGQMRLLEYVLPGTAMELSTALAVRVRAVRKGDKEIEAPGTKTYNRNRVVRVAEFAWDAVLELMKGKHPDSLMFDGIPHRFHARDAHYGAVEALRERMPILVTPKRYTLRDHRHTWAVRAVRSGWPIHAVSEQLGHSNGVLALKVYGRFQPKSEERGRWEEESHRLDQRRRAEGES